MGIAQSYVSYGTPKHCMAKSLEMINMGMGQNHVVLVNIKIGGKWMFIP